MKKEALDLISDCLQVYNTLLLEKDASNNDVMKALQDQNTRYFELMVRQLEEIKSLLKQQDITNEVKLWLSDMLIMMNNKDGEHNKQLPVGKFENKMRELLYKLNGGEND